MAGIDKAKSNSLTGVANEGTWPGLDSRFRLIIVAGLRTKQLLHGSTPRIELDQKRRKNTSIALEEVKRGLIHFTRFNKDGSLLEDGTEFGLNPGDKDYGKVEVRAHTGSL